MQLSVSPRTYFVFDLDDTLIYEADFLESAFREISSRLIRYTKKSIYSEMLDKYQSGDNVFEWIVSRYGHENSDLNIDWLLNVYHDHLPSLAAREDALNFIRQLKSLAIPMGILTDGQGIRQRNKLTAAGIEHYFTDVIISEEFGSEKPDERNYLYFMARYPANSFVMVGDNTDKDFIVPQKLGWQTVCVRDGGRHIHRQTFRRNSLPDFIINSFDELELKFHNQSTAYQENFT